MVAAPESIVILGGGQAGAWAARTLRTEGYTGVLSLVSEEPHAPYERPALSKGVLAGTAAPESIQVFKPDVLAGLDLRVHRRVRATSLDRGSRRVSLSDGAAVRYDKLLFCTGGRAVRPPVDGIDLPGVFTLRTLDDCRHLADALAAARHVCVVGGGWIGLEVASTAIALGKDVVLLERGPRLCRRVLPATVAEHLLALHRQAGVDVRLATGAERIDRVNGRLRVSTAPGEAVQTDLVVVGAGLVPNDELAAQAGLRCARGIVVDARCITSDPDILAAGDVAVAPNSWAGGLVRLESWQNATEQAVIAARSALGAPCEYDPLPWFWSEQHGVNVQIYGWPRPGQRALTRPVGAGSFLTFLLEGEWITGAVAVNAPRELRAARKLIEQRTPVRESDLLDANVRLSTL